MAKFNMAAIIKLSQNEWVKIFLCKMAESHDCRIQDGCHYQFEWECMSEVFLCKWLNPRWQNSIWLPSSSWVRMNEWSFCAYSGKQSWQVWVSLRKKLRWLNANWQNSRWLPSSSSVRMNEFESDWISLSQSQNGERVFLSVSQRRKQGVWIQNSSVWNQYGRIQDGCHHQVESEWMSEVFCVQVVGTNLGKCEWVWEEKLLWLNPRWWNSSWQNSRWLPSSSWVRMNEWRSFLCKMAESMMAEFRMAAIIKLSQNEWVEFCTYSGKQSWQVWVSLRKKN